MLRGLVVGSGPMAAVRRGVDRELARALGAICSPILPLATGSRLATSTDVDARCPDYLPC
jgi:hypothetical protein